MPEYKNTDSEYKNRTVQYLKYDAKDAFIEVCDAFGIGKIRLGFRRYNKTAEAGDRVNVSIDYYMTPVAAMELAEYILSGVIKSRKTKWAAGSSRNDNEEFYATSPTGTDKDGKTWFRVVKILPGNKGYRIVANQCEGKRDAKGLIQPLAGAKPSYVMIPIDGIQLAVFAKRLQQAVKDYDSYTFREYLKAK